MPMNRMVTSWVLRRWRITWVTVSHEMGKLDEAEKHYFNAYEIYKDVGTISDECRSLNNIGLILYDRKAYDSALVYFHGRD